MRADVMEPVFGYSDIRAAGPCTHVVGRYSKGSLDSNFTYYISLYMVPAMFLHALQRVLRSVWASW